MMDSKKKEIAAGKPYRWALILTILTGMIIVLIGIYVKFYRGGLENVAWIFILILSIVGMVAGLAFGRRWAKIMGKGQIGEENGENDPTSVKERMAQLQSLYDRRQITPEEYEQKRKEILKEL